MRTRVRALVVAGVTVAGLALGGGATAVASPTAAPAAERPDGGPVGALDYWQFHDHYATLEECVAVGEEYLYPHNPGGADDYECEAKGDGWDLWLIFAT
ncbi:hypothetical protein [Streptomyces sp. B6B3]|uniref:hypothetical protein n=1 Tax=Streptomyces sp. B6B3 TaxID=3153570 RepID=UPI00325D9E3F